MGVKRCVTLPSNDAEDLKGPSERPTLLATVPHHRCRIGESMHSNIARQDGFGKGYGHYGCASSFCTVLVAYVSRMLCDESLSCIEAGVGYGR
jgi:hypothetical protein